MTREYLKKATLTSTSDTKNVSATVQSILKDFEMEVIPGLIAGQKSIPVDAAGC